MDLIVHDHRTQYYETDKMGVLHEMILKYKSLCDEKTNS